MERFTKLSLNIQNLSSEVAMHHLVIALWSGPFIDNLCKKPTTNLDELRQRTKKFVQLEELRDYRNQVRSENGGDKGKEKDWGDQHVPERGHKYRENRGPQLM